MRILLDISYLYSLMKAQGRSTDVERRFFDELLLAQAQLEDLKLLTADRQLIGHPLSITA